MISTILALYAVGQLSDWRPCVYDSAQDFPSPSGSYEVSIKRHVCAGADKYETVVILARHGSKPGERGSAVEVFTAPTLIKSGESPGGLIDLKVRWVRESKLEITIPKDIKWDSGFTEFGGVSVEYKIE